MDLEFEALHTQITALIALRADDVELVAKLNEFKGRVKAAQTYFNEHLEQMANKVDELE
jgi:hypothetical protein